MSGVQTGVRMVAQVNGGGLVRKLLLSLVALIWPASVSAQVIEYYHLDALGSVRAITNGAATPVVVERHEYLPFGEEHLPGQICPPGSPSTVCQPKEFTGKERDVETGLDYFGARYYGSKVGRFTTIDPVYTWRENLVDPQRWNRYAYARNNPLRYVDPDGRVLVLSGTASAQAQATAIANGGLFGQRLVLANGVASLQSTGQQGPPTPGQAALAETLGGVIADKSTTRISLSEGSSTTLTGSWAKSDIDVSDMAMFGSGPGPTAAGKLGHEVTEQYLKQVQGIGDFAKAHSQAVGTENRITGWVRSTSDTGQLNGALSGSITQTAARDGRILRTNLSITNGNITKIERQ